MISMYLKDALNLRCVHTSYSLPSSVRVRGMPSRPVWGALSGEEKICTGKELNCENDSMSPSRHTGDDARPPSALPLGMSTSESSALPGVAYRTGRCTIAERLLRIREVHEWCRIDSGAGATLPLMGTV